MHDSTTASDTPSTAGLDDKGLLAMVRRQITAARLAWGCAVESRDALSAYEDTLRKDLEHAAALSEVSIKFFGRTPY